MKKKKLFIWLLVVLVVVVFIICLISILKSLNNKKELDVKVINSIEKYGYNLKDNEIDYYKELFNELKINLDSDNINEEEYAKTISKMFLTDFFSLENANNKNDIGGLDFIYSDYKDNFITKAKDTIYAYVENNLYGDRNQQLPLVKEVKINKIEKKKYDNLDDNAYYIEASIIYEKDLGYQTSCNLILIHSNKKLEIVSMN
jgi:hypothetical protein